MVKTPNASTSMDSNVDTTGVNSLPMNNKHNVCDFSINGRRIGSGQPTYIIAEMSCNHLGSKEKAMKIVKAMAESGADCCKLQTYTADTMTLDCDSELFLINSGTQWDSMTLHKLYDEAHTPWEWHKEIMEYAKSLGMDCFSSPFSASAVDFLETLNTPAYKIASFEVNDIPLLKKIASTGKPVIVSSGQATLSDLDLAVRTLREGGCTQICILKCTSAYPALPSQCNLAAIPFLSQAFGVPTGLSDHTLGIAVPVVATTLGGNVIEKHFILDRNDGGHDALFSLEPAEFKQMVDQVRVAEQAVGTVVFGTISKTKRFCRSIFVAEDVKEGEIFTEKNLRCIRPVDGLHTRHWEDVLGKKACHDVKKGTPMAWNLISS